MFEQSVVEVRALAARPWTLAVSLAGQGFLISAAILMPLVRPDVLQRAAFWVPVTDPPRAYHAPAPVKVDVARPPVDHRPVRPFALTEPSRVPTRIQILQDPLPEVTGAVGGSSEGGVPGGLDLPGPGSSIVNGLAQLAPPVVPATVQPVVKPLPQPALPKITRITVGGKVQEARLIVGPHPEYPPLAKQARVSGIVHLSALIGTDGRIAGLHMIDGHPLLVRAAMDAVKRWVYRPTMLNDDPVEVVTEITVTFTLN